MKYEYASVDDIYADAGNIRTLVWSDEMDELMVSLRDRNQLVPLICYEDNGRRMLADGHRRLGCMKRLGWKKASICLLDRPPDAAELLVAQIHVNGRRQDVNPVDLLAAYLKVMELKNLTPTQLAAAVGAEPSKVTLILALTKLEDKHRELVRTGKIPLSTAYALARMEPGQREECVHRILSGELKRDQVQAKVRKRSAGDRVKTRRVCCELAQGKVTVSSETGLCLSSLIELLDGLLRQCKKARTNGWDISTTMRVLQDSARQGSQPQATG